MEKLKNLLKVSSYIQGVIYSASNSEVVLMMGCLAQKNTPVQNRYCLDC